MATHIIILGEHEADSLISGSKVYIFRFFKKKPDFFNELKIGDLVFFRKGKGDVLGQFEISKLIFSENVDDKDWSWIKEIADGKLGLKEKEFLGSLTKNNTVVIIQINKLEQFITSPVEIDKRSKKEWIVLS